MELRTRVAAPARKVVVGAKRKAIGPLPDDATFMLPMRLVMGNTTTLTNPFMQHPWVNACTIRIMRNIGGLNFRVLTRGKDPSKTSDDQPLTEKDHPLVKLFTDFNPNVQSASEFWQLVVAFMVLEGEAMCIKVNPTMPDGAPRSKADGNESRPLTEVPGELWVLSGRFFKPVLAENGVLEGWDYQPQKQAKTVHYKADDVIQFRFVNPFQPLRGISLIEALRLGLDQDFLMQLFNKAFFENSADPGGMLTFPELVQEDLKKTILAAWNERHRGSAKAGKVGIIDQGGKYEHIPTTHQSMQFTEQRDSHIEEILAVMGVPKAEVSLYEDVNYATATEASRSFWQKTLIPIIKILELTLDRRLFTKVEAGKYTGAFDLTPVAALQENVTEQADSAKKLIDTGVAPNDARKLAGLETKDYEWGKEPLVTPNLVPISLVASQTELPKPQPPPGQPGTNPGQPQGDGKPGDGAGGDGTQEGEDRPGIVQRTARAERKLTQWRRVLKTVLDPNELTMRSKLKSYVYQLRTEQLKLLDKATKNVDLAGLGVKVRAAMRDWDPAAAADVIGNHQLASDHSIERLFALCAKDLDEEEIDEQVLFNRQTWDNRLKAATRPVYTQTVQDAAKSVEAELGGSFVFDATDPRVVQFLQRKELKLASVNGTIARNVRGALVQGLANQESGQELSERLKQVFNFATSRTFMIARTETAQAANGARDLAFRAEGVELQEWSTAGDEHVREDHIAFGESEPRPLGFNWMSIAPSREGGSLEYACDDNGPASEVINCRCVMLAAS